MRRAQQTALHNILTDAGAGFPVNVTQELDFFSHDLENLVALARRALLEVANHPQPAALLHVSIDQVGQRAVDVHAHPLDPSCSNHAIDHQVQAKMLDIFRVQMKVVVINFAGNIAFDPGQVIPCHAVQLLGGIRSCSSCMMNLEEMGIESDGHVSRGDEGRCPAE